MRNLKTALSVFICIVLYQTFDFRYPFYAVAAAIISMETSVISSLKIGRNRLMGTVLGAFIGLCFALVSPGNAFLTAIGIMVIIYLCNLRHWNQSITIAAVVFISIMLNIGEGQIVEYSLSRILDTFIGILIGLAVNFLIVPYNFEKSIKKQFIIIKKDVQQLIQESICTSMEQNRDNCTTECCGKMQDTLVELNASINHLKEELKEYTSEIKIKHTSKQRMEDVVSIVNIFKETYAHLKVIAPIVDGRQLSNDNYIKLDSLGFHMGLIQWNEELNYLDQIFNYHLGIVLENTERLEIATS